MTSARVRSACTTILGEGDLLAMRDSFFLREHEQNTWICVSG